MKLYLITLKTPYGTDTMIRYGTESCSISIMDFLENEAELSGTDIDKARERISKDQIAKMIKTDKEGIFFLYLNKEENITVRVEELDFESMREIEECFNQNQKKGKGKRN